jgi:hypothetical protein
MEKNDTNLPQNLPYGHKIHQIALKYQITTKHTKNFHSKTFKKIPELVCNYTIQQPWIPLNHAATASIFLFC